MLKVSELHRLSLGMIVEECPKRTALPYTLQQHATHRLLSSSFLGLPYRTLNINHKKELLRSLWIPVCLDLCFWVDGTNFV